MRRRTGSIQSRPQGYRIRYTDLDGIRHSETFPDRETAESELSSRLNEINKGLPVSSKPNTVRFGELCADVITDYEVNKYRSIDDIEARFRLHIEPVFGQRKASQITNAQIKSYIVKRSREGASTGTINRELEAIRHTFRLAIEGRKLFHMPTIKTLREDNVRSGFFTREEVERLCSHLPAPLDSFVRFAFLTGWRLEEIRGLKWSNVNFASNEIRLDAGKTKNREARVFPMCDELRRLLELIAPTQTAPGAGIVVPKRMAAFPATFVFVLRGKPIGEFRKTWKTANHKAGLPCIYDVKGNLVRAVRIFHDLRRSACIEMERQGMSRSVIKALMGHKTDSMFNRYRIVGDSDLRDAVSKLNRTTKRTTEGSGNGGKQ